MTKFIYHKDCADGFCAAFLFWLAYGDKGIEYTACQYGEGLPLVTWDRDDLVVIADFSFSPVLLTGLAGVVDRVVVLDHHKTALEALKGASLPENVELHLDNEKCGSRLLYDWLLERSGMQSMRTSMLSGRKMLVDYVEDRDLWLWRMDNSREVSAAIASYPKDFEIWSRFDVEALDAEGAAILRYQKQLVASICKNARSEGGRVSVNSCVLQSEVGEELGRGADYADVWWDNGAGEVVHSLRSRPDGADVSAIASALGGGGHKHAAGYKVSI